MDLKELRDKRGKAVADARAILDTAEAEKRALTPEEDAQYSALIKEVGDLKETIDRNETQAKLEKEMAAMAIADAPETPDTPNTNPRASAIYNEAVAIMVVEGAGGLSADHIKALTTNSDTDGGYLVLPEQWAGKLIKAMDNIVFLRSKGTVFPLTKAVSLGAPSMESDVDDADWTTELSTGSNDTGLSFGKRQLTPHPFAKRVKISNNLLRNSSLPVDTLAMQRLAYKAGITEEKGFMTGTGTGQALGIFTASDQGIPTSRDVSTGNTATAPTFDGLMAAKYSLKGQYWNQADWVFHRNVLEVLAKIKNGDGQYIWRESVRAGEPDILLGRPIMMSEYAPNTLTASQYVGMLGDFSNYWIADALDIQIRVLSELYQETNQTGLILRKETDGMPVLGEAFARVKLAAS